MIPYRICTYALVSSDTEWSWCWCCGHNSNCGDYSALNHLWDINNAAYKVAVISLMCVHRGVYVVCV